jgi:hypothetical protein
MLDVADRLRQRVDALGVKVQVYLLDRQFWTYDPNFAQNLRVSMLRK